jgi:hypothetical protein
MSYVLRPPTSAAADLLSPNLNLPVGLGFQLVGFPTDPIVPVSPLVLVGLNPEPLPLGPQNPQFIDLSTPLAPKILITGAGSTSVYWYMQSATPFIPSDPVFPPFTQMEGNGHVFTTTFTISGNSQVLVALSPQPDSPDVFQGFMATFDLPIVGGPGGPGLAGLFRDGEPHAPVFPARPGTRCSLALRLRPPGPGGMAEVQEELTDHYS